MCGICNVRGHHVVLGRPSLLLLSGLHSKTVTQSFSLSYLIILPIQFHLRRVISKLVVFIPVISWICWWEMVWCHLILSMRFMHLYWKAYSFFASVFVSFQASQPYVHQNGTINCFKQLNLRPPANLTGTPNPSHPVEGLSSFT